MRARSSTWRSRLKLVSRPVDRADGSRWAAEAGDEARTRDADEGGVELAPDGLALGGLAVDGAGVGWSLAATATVATVGA
jgi:hypothetical protein